MRGATLLAPFGIAGFAGLWVSASAGSFARTTTHLTFGWLTLQATDSPFLVGVVAAARMAPQLVLGIPAGAISDVVDRRTLLIAVNAASTLLLLGVVVAALAGVLALPAILGAVVLFGALDTLRTAVSQAYAYDLVRAARAMSGMALTNLGAQLFGTLGGLVGGWALGQYGGPAAFALVAFILLVATVAPLFGTGRANPGVLDLGSGASDDPEAAPAQPVAAASLAGERPDDSAPAVSIATALVPTASVPTASAAARTRPDFRQAATLVLRNRLLGVLALAILVTEILGFATQTLLPTFARDVFAVGPEGYGTLTATRSAGGVLGLLLLTRLGTSVPAGTLFVTACATLGLALFVFAVTPIYLLALLLLAVAGGASSMLDTLGQMLLQRHADERERGAAMGLWVFCVGFGPVGHLTLGKAAETFGAPQTQVVAAGLLTLVAVLLATHAPLRRAR